MKSFICPRFSVMDALKGCFTLHFPYNLGIWLHSPEFLVIFMLIPSLSHRFPVLEGKSRAISSYIKATVIHGSPTSDCTCRVKVLVYVIPLFVLSFLNILIFTQHLHRWKLGSWRGMPHMQFIREYRLASCFLSNN